MKGWKSAKRWSCCQFFLKEALKFNGLCKIVTNCAEILFSSLFVNLFYCWFDLKNVYWKLNVETFKSIQLTWHDIMDVKLIVEPKWMRSLKSSCNGKHDQTLWVVVNKMKCEQAVHLVKLNGKRHPITITIETKWDAYHRKVAPHYSWHVHEEIQ